MLTRHLCESAKLLSEMLYSVHSPAFNAKVADLPMDDALDARS